MLFGLEGSHRRLEGKKRETRDVKLRSKREKRRENVLRRKTLDPFVELIVEVLNELLRSDSVDSRFDSVLPFERGRKERDQRRLWGCVLFAKQTHDLS